MCVFVCACVYGKVSDATTAAERRVPLSLDSMLTFRWGLEGNVGSVRTGPHGGTSQPQP